MAMKKLYCPECGAYCEGGSGDLVDCHCGWKQPEQQPQNARAEWTLELNVTCPECQHLFDLTHNDDFWEGVDTCEHETPRTTDYECYCPECDHEFLCDFVY